MKIYQFDMSPNVKRVRIVANEVGEPFTIVTLDPMKGEHMAPDFVAKNPNHKVPTVELDDGSVLWESAAICLYLASKYPEKKLVSADPRARAEIAKWMFWNASHLEAALFTILLEKLFAKFVYGRDASEIKLKDAQADVDRFAPILNAQLEGHPYVAGNDFSIADICIGSTLEFAIQTGNFDIAPYKHAAAWLGKLQARDAWKKS